MELQNEDIIGEMTETRNVSDFILELRGMLDGCTFEKSYRLVGHVLITVAKVRPKDSKMFELELHNNYLLFRGKNRRWEELFYDNAKEYIENYININRNNDKYRRFRIFK